MKKTAVKWLIEQLNKKGFSQVVMDEEIQQALEIEKQQIIDAWIDGDARICETKSIPHAEQYYNETFKQEEKEKPFEKGDVVEYCDEKYFVIENNGTTGVVKPFGENLYMRNFIWKFEDFETKFIRKATIAELKYLGF